MSLFKKTERRALPSSIDPYQLTARPFYSNYSGELVNEYTAFAHSALYGAVTLLSDAIAVMPLELLRIRGGRTERLPTPSVLIRPNEQQTMFDFIHQTVMMLSLHGCAYIYAPRKAGELPPEMKNIHPNQVKPVSDVTSSSLFYDIGKERYTQSEIRAIHWVLFPGQTRGISPLEAQRNTIGMGIAMDRFLSQFYGEGATPSSVLETDQQVSQQQADLLRQTWEDSHVKHRRPAVLSGGLKWRSITTSASDMQMIQHRESIIRDIARAYRIPLNLIVGSGGETQTYQNVEQSGINFVRYTLMPWMRRIEDAISEMLPLTQKVRFNADEFMRADVTTRVRAEQIQIMSGTLSPNEAREMENREPYEGGDFFVNPSMIPSAGTDAVPPER